MPDERLQNIISRVASFPISRLHDPADGGDWRYGAPPAYLRELCAYWTTDFEWRAQEAALNRLAQFTAEVDGLPIHFIHEPGSGTRPPALLILHGWPYSFASYAHLIDSLAHPERHGGHEADAFTVVVPSLPGYAFSGALNRPVGPRAVMAMLDSLMTDVLGLSGYLVHRGDWGGYMTSLTGLDHPDHVAGIHSCFVAMRDASAPLQSGKVADDASDEEKAFVAREMQLWTAEGAYGQVHSTRPLAPAPAMLDSPVGVAAWIADKFHAWSDRRERDFEALFTRDQLLTEIMLDLVTDAFDTATWIYAGRQTEGRVELPAGKRIEVPTAVAAFPDPVFPTPPPCMVKRSHNLVRYTVMPRGGHFPFYEAPDLLVDDLRAFARLL